PFSQDSLGNTISNTRQLQLNTQANFETLYNKVPLLKEINTGKKPKPTPPKGKDDPSKKDGFGKDQNPKEEKVQINPLHLGLRFLMMVRGASGTYTRNEGMQLPGYNRQTRILGFDENFDGPGIGFLLGQQNTDVWGNPI